VSLSAVSLVVANLLPLAGVLLLGWDLFTLVALYWLETLAIVLLNVPKMAMASAPVAEGAAPPGFARLVVIPFFLVHSGMFMLVHGVFIVVIFSGLATGREPSLSPLRVNAWNLALAFLALAVSHTISFFHNFVAEREYERVSIQQQMAQPYRRIVAMHLFILLSAFLAMAVGSALPALVLVVAVKTAVDLRAHLREHAREGARVPGVE
jgi:hypothetical protein